MREEADVPLAGLTTSRVGGPARRLVTAETPEEVAAAVAAADRRGEALLLLGGGSNLLVGDAGFDGTVVRIAGGALSWEERPDAGGGSALHVAVDAGVGWDALVADAVARGAAGVECLSGIPGSAGATPVQNVGAYGQEVAETITGVEVYDRRTGVRRRLAPAECGFAYRHSVFKGDDRYVVLRVYLGLPSAPGGLSAPVRYAELARALGVEAGARAPLGAVRDAVLALRRGKGMVLDAADHDTWSTGSFFTNPILDAAAYAELCRRVSDVFGTGVHPPGYPEPDGRVKTSAAWLIERAGFAKGYGDGPARISGKHSLALTNRGGARAADLLALAREVRDGVAACFGVPLRNEPLLIGLSLEEPDGADPGSGPGRGTGSGVAVDKVVSKQ